MAVGQRTPPWLTQTSFAHRGLHNALIPENSLEAAEAAIAAGLGIECDIQLSGNKTPFVFHDWELERLTGRQGRFEGLSDVHVGALKLLGTPSSPQTLGRFVDVVGQRTPLLIEIKSMPEMEVETISSQVLRAVADFTGYFAVMSFDPNVVGWFAANAPALCRGLVGTDSLSNGFEYVWRDRKRIEQSQPHFLAIDYRDLRSEKASLWRASGKPLLSWTIQTREERQHAQTLADALIMEGDALL